MRETERPRVPTESEVPDVELRDLSTPGLARVEAAAPVVLVLAQVDQSSRPHHGHSIVSGEWSWHEQSGMASFHKPRQISGPVN